MTAVPLRSRPQLARMLRAAATGPQSDATTLALPAQIDDLWTLYAHARLTGAVSALEIGAGWSTLVLALALDENAAGYDGRYTARHPAPFVLRSLEADAAWAEVAVGRLPAHLASRVHLSVSRVVEHSAGNAHGTAFEMVDPVAPDVIYIDGPDPGQGEPVLGQYPDEHGLPMSLDLLRLEPYLWPGTSVIVDGRTANARMLVAHLVRSWEHWHDPFGDRSWLRLAEEPLGRHNREHLDARMMLALETRAKGGSWGMPL